MEGFPRMITRFTPILRVALGALFVYAAFGKLNEPVSFQAQILKLMPVPDHFAEITALYLPWLEVACGLALISGRLRVGAVTLVITMLVAFEIVLLRAWLSGIEADCGCFGSLFGGSSVQIAFFRNIALLGIGVWILFHEIQIHMNERSLTADFTDYQD